MPQGAEAGIKKNSGQAPLKFNNVTKARRKKYFSSY